MPGDRPQMGEKLGAHVSRLSEKETSEETPKEPSKLKYMIIGWAIVVVVLVGLGFILGAKLG